MDSAFKPGGAGGLLLNTSFLLKAALIVGGGGLIFGYDIGVISTTISSMKKDIPMSPLEEGAVMGIMGAGACAGALFAGPLCDYIGRWRTIQLQNLLFCVGSIVTAASMDLTSLYLGRFVIGCASVVSSIADVPYLMEICPSSVRGQMTSTYELMTSFGVLLSFLCGYLLCGGATDVADGWRVAYMLPVVLSIVQSLMMFFMPESPKWLLEKGRLVDAKTSLCEVYGQSQFDWMVRDWTMEIVEVEMKGSDVGSRGTTVSPMAIGTDNREEDISPSSEAHSSSSVLEMEEDIMAYCEQVRRNELSHTESVNDDSRHYVTEENFSWESFKSGILDDLKVMSEYQYPLAIALGVQALTQLSGGVVVRNYADSLFQMEGSSANAALGFTAILGGVKFVFTVFSVYMLEIAGRKILFVVGCLVVAAGMFTLVMASLAASGVTSEAEREVNTSVQVTAIALVVGGYGIGYGPIAWILSSELFPVLLRGKVMAMVLICQNVFLLVTNLVFLLMLDTMTAAGTFGFFLAVNLLGAALCWALLVESKSKSPEVILLHLRDRLSSVRGSVGQTLGYQRLCEAS